jgi:hypothetical protein
MKIPFPLASKVHGPLLGRHNFGKIVSASGFKQENTDSRIFSQPTCDH